MNSREIIAGDDLKTGDAVVLKEVDGKTHAFKVRPKPKPAPHGEYEVINPSDKCYLTGAGEALCAAGIFLGRGRYGLCDKDGNEGLPIFLFGGLDEWWVKQYGHAFEAYMDTKPYAAIADVLATFRYAGERSSMNDIGAAAKNIVKSLRLKAKEA